MSIDSLELQLASAMQRFNSLQRRATAAREPAHLLNRSLHELREVIEQLRVAQEQLVEQRRRMEALQEEMRKQNARYWQLFDEIPQPYVVTRSDSTIVEVNKAAAELLNVSQRFLAGKALSVFVCEDRSGFLSRIAELVAHRTESRFDLKVRPRERAPLTVRAVARADEASVRWHFHNDVLVPTLPSELETASSL
jgi:PAS domain S-box-containing protein